MQQKIFKKNYFQKIKKVMLQQLILLQVVTSLALAAWPNLVYYPKNGGKPTILSPTDDLSGVAGFNAKERTVFIIHGFITIYTDWRMQDIKNNFVAYTGHNIIMVDWYEGAGSTDDIETVLNLGAEYVTAVNNLKYVAGNITNFINSNQAFINPENTWCVGHSLGMV